MPLFLDLVRQSASADPAAAAKALNGLRIYQEAQRDAAQRSRSMAVQVEGACLRDCGGSGAPIVLVPSLINPPNVLDLDEETSLAEALTPAGHVLLLDWGSAAARTGLDVSGHVRELLVPMVERLGERPALVGYCLGGTMALAAGTMTPVRAIATLAAPWNFSAYPQDARDALRRIWNDARPGATQLGVLPIEVLQAAFWSLDPRRVVAKYARLPDLDPQGPELRRFLSLEDWANGGEPLPLPAARELIEELFGGNPSGSGKWFEGELPACPLLHFTAHADRIVPAATAAPGKRVECPAGHVGMIVGRSAGEHLHRPLREWLARTAQHG